MVLAIIGIIAAILVPTMFNYIKKAAAKTDMANGRQIYNSVNAREQRVQTMTERTGRKETMSQRPL